MIGYYFDCPHCADVTPVSIDDMTMHSRRPDVMCFECGESGCTTCMPNEVCEDCKDRLAEEEDDTEDWVDLEVGEDEVFDERFYDPELNDDDDVDV